MKTTTVQEPATPVSLVAFFEGEQGIEDAYRILEDLEYPPVSITMGMAEKTYQDRYAGRTASAELPKTDAQGGPDNDLDQDGDVKSTKATEGFTLGIAAGAGLGFLTMLGAAVVFPGVVIVGPVVASLTGAGAGAAAGGLTGLLFGSGHPEDEAKKYQERIAAGKYMIRVSPKSHSDATIIEREWKSLGGEIETHY